MKRSRGLLVLMFLSMAVGVVTASEDLMRAAAEIENRYQRQFDQIEARHDQERIKLNSRLRDGRAKVQRAAQATVAGAVALMGDPAKLAQIQFDEAELSNRFENEWERAVTDRFDQERATLERKKALESAKLAAQHLDAGEETAKYRDLALKGAEITERWQEKLDALRFEESAALASALRAGRTKENLAAKAMAEWLAQRLAKAQESGQIFNAMGDAAYLDLTAKRDDARNATETEQETIRAKFEAQRRELERARDEAMSALMG